MTDGELIDIALKCNIIDHTQLLDFNQYRSELIGELQHFAAKIIEHEHARLHKELGTVAWAGEDLGWDRAIGAVRSHLISLHADYDC